MTVSTDESNARAALVRVVRDGNPPNGTQPADCGAWAPVIQNVYAAHASGGTSAARDVYTAMANADYGVAALLAGEPAQADDQPEPWESPLPLGHATEVLPVFPTEALPAWLRTYVDALATATQTPADMAATLALAVLATTCQRHTRVCVRPDWVEPTNLYTLVAMPPGNRKSAVFAALVRPIEAYEAAETARMAPARGEAKSDLEILENRMKIAQRDAASGKGNDAAIAQQTARELAAEIAQFRVPALPRFICGDVTPEKLASLLCEQGGRMALLDAEGGFFDILAGRYSNGQPNLDAVLKGHAGDTLRVDRGTRPSEFVEQPALTLGLAVQPAVLDGLAATASFRGKGLLGRFLYSLPPSPVGMRAFDAPAVPAHADAAYHRHMTALMARPTELDDKGAAVPDTLHLTTAALAALREMHEWLEPQMSEGAELGSFSDWAGKLLGAIARIAGLLHMADHGPAGIQQPISGPTMAAAVLIGRYYLAHAQAAFGMIGADAGVELARRVWRAIAQRGGSTITRREIHRLSIGGVRTVDDLDAPLNLLIRHGYVRLSPPPPSNTRGGRKPTPVYEVNPLSSDRTDRTALAATFAPLGVPDTGGSVSSVSSVSSPHFFSDAVAPDVLVVAHAPSAPAPIEDDLVWDEV